MKKMGWGHSWLGCFSVFTFFALSSFAPAGSLAENFRSHRQPVSPIRPGYPSRMAEAPALPATVRSVPAQFDQYVLAMSYENTFCLMNPTRSECGDRSRPTGMVLHGLWPNRLNDPQHSYGYCDLTQDQVGADWCAPGIDVSQKMLARDFSELSRVMPGVSACLHIHEWYAHGSCSGMSVQDFFVLSTDLAKRFLDLPSFNVFLTGHVGQAVSRSQILEALSADLGAGSVRSLVISCRVGNVDQKPYFAEVAVSMDRNQLVHFPAPQSLVPSAPLVKPDGSTGVDLGNCPADGIILPGTAVHQDQRFARAR